MSEMLSEIACLPCGHVYHVNCIDSCLEYNPQCPTCREDVTKKDGVRLIHFEVTSNVTEAAQKFFEGMSDSEKKSLKVMHKKLKAAVEEKGKLVSKIESKDQRISELEKIIANLKSVSSNNKETIKNQKSHMERLKLKVGEIRDELMGEREENSKLADANKDLRIQAKVTDQLGENDMKNLKWADELSNSKSVSDQAHFFKNAFKSSIISIAGIRKRNECLEAKVKKLESRSDYQSRNYSKS